MGQGSSRPRIGLVPDDGTGAGGAGGGSGAGAAGSAANLRQRNATMRLLTPQPPSDQLNKMFDLLLEDLNLPPDKKEQMRQYDDARKWAMMQATLKDQGTSDLEPSEEEIRTEVASLKNNPTKELLQSMSISLRSRPIRWVSKFAEQQGITALLNHLINMDEKAKEDGQEELVIKCLKALMNNSYGLTAVMANPNSINYIALSLRSSKVKVVTMVLEILGAVCLIPHGHKRILEAMDNLSKITRRKRRFAIVIDCLGWEDQNYDRQTNLQIACLSFINVVISFGPGKEQDFRIHVRNEFLDCGLDAHIEFLENSAESDILKRQLKIFIQKAKNDHDALAEKYDKRRMDASDMTEVYNTLLYSLNNSSALSYFKSIMQHMLLFPINPARRPVYFRFADQIIQQLVLQKDGDDPDLTAFSEFDVKSLIDNWINEEKVKDAIAKKEAAEKKAKEAGKTIEAAKTEANAAIERSKKEAVEAATAANEAKIRANAFEREINKLASLLKERFENKSDAVAILDRLSEQAMEEAKVANPMGHPGGYLSISISSPVTSGFDVGTSSSPGSALSAGIDGPPPPPPPPPPGGDFGGPPPPPPPPPGFGGAPPPPPPPGMAGFAPVMGGLPEKKKKLSEKALKPFNWSKLPNHAIKGTIWSEINDEPVLKQLRPELTQMEDLFSVYTPVETEKASESSSSLAPQAPKEIQVLDARKSQNLMILLKTLNLSTADIKRAVLNLDEYVLPRHVVDQLLKFVPTDEEIASIREHEKEVDKLGKAEKFYYEVSKIKRYGPRLECFYFKRVFDERIGDIQKGTTAMLSAASDLYASKRFRKLLEVILAVGNYLNSGFRGGAYGFKVDAILKMTETKTSLYGGKHTLLHYLYELIDKNYKDLQQFSDDLGHVAMGAKVSLPTLKTEMQHMRKGLNALKQELDVRKDDPILPEDEFMTVMRNFFAEASRAAEKLEMDYAQAEIKFVEVVQLFGEDPKGMTPEEFFGIFARFVNNWVVAGEELKDWRAKEIAEQNRQKTHSKSRSKENVNAVGGADGQLDDLISVLRTGEAFNETFDPSGDRVGQSANSDKKKPAKKKAVGTVAKKGANVDLGQLDRSED